MAVQSPRLAGELILSGEIPVPEGRLDDTALLRLDMGDASLRCLELRGCTLTGCRFPGTSFERVYMRDVILTDCDLSACRFDDGFFERVAFTGCRLTGAGFTGCTLRDVSFDGCNLSYSSFNGARVNLMSVTGSNLGSASLSSVTLRGLETRDSIWQDVNFFHTPLRGVDFTEATVGGLILSDTYGELRGAVMTPAQACDAARLLGIKIKEV